MIDTSVLKHKNIIFITTLHMFYHACDISSFIQIAVRNLVAIKKTTNFFHNCKHIRIDRVQIMKSAFIQTFTIVSHQVQ